MTQEKAYYWNNETSQQILDRACLSKGETTQSRIKDIAVSAEKYLNKPGFAEKFCEYMALGYYSLASPIWANSGKKRGLPVSCANSHVSDSVGGILQAQGEVGMFSKLGAGTSGYFGDVRPRGTEITDNGKSTGSVHFLELFQATTDVISQGSNRRGRMAPYLPIDHGDIEEFLDIGSDNHVIQHMNHGVVVDDYWMTSMVNGDSDKRKIWAKLLKRRKEVGYPYLMFRTTANENKPQVYKDKDYVINSSNLCNEIYLPSNESESFTCILSSMNLLHYDEWKDTDAVETLIYFLDAIASEFIDKLEAYRDSDNDEDNLVWHYMKRYYEFTKNHRALGMGVLGWHSFLQSKMIPFESKEAAKLNLEIFKSIRQQADSATEKLAKEYGEPPILKGYGRRNTTTLAIAPTMTSSAILGQVSQSIEPFMSNYYIKDLNKVKVVFKNKYLEQLLEDKGLNTKAIWDSIADNDGSVLHLPGTVLTPEEKAVFLASGEINQNAVIDQAAIRQTYIDQGQSINLKPHESISTKDFNALHIKAWEMGLKGLYYVHSTNAAQTFLRDNNNMECVACGS